MYTSFNNLHLQKQTNPLLYLSDMTELFIMKENDAIEKLKQIPDNQLKANVISAKFACYEQWRYKRKGDRNTIKCYLKWVCPRVQNSKKMKIFELWYIIVFFSGKYNDGTDNVCHRCPEGYTTQGRGSTSAEDCTGENTKSLFSYRWEFIYTEECTVGNSYLQRNAQVRIHIYKNTQVKMYRLGNSFWFLGKY